MIVDENLKDCSDELLKAYKAQVRYKRFAYILATLLAVSTGILAGILKNTSKENKILTVKVQQDEQILTLEYSIGYWFINTPEPVNDSILYQFLMDNGAWYPDILLKQAKLESGNYTSNVYNNTCNLYGMKKVGKRQTTQRGVYNGYGVYDNWCLSVLDRMLWDVFVFNNIKPTEEEYLKALNVYAEDENYIKKLNL